MKNIELMKKEYTIQEVAKLLNVTAPTIRNWAAKGKLNITKNGRWVIERSELNRLLLSMGLVRPEMKLDVLCLKVDGVQAPSTELSDALIKIKNHLGDKIYKLCLMTGRDDIRSMMCFKGLVESIMNGEINSVSYLDKEVFPTKDFRLLQWICYNANTKLEQIQLDSDALDSVYIGDDLAYEYVFE